MNKKLFVYIILVTSFFLASNFFFEKKTITQNTLIDCNHNFIQCNTNKPFDLNIIKSGDIIFRKENSFISNLFSNIEKSEYSHVAIAINIDGNLKFYHMETNEEKHDLKIDNFENFTKHTSKLGIYRFNKDIDNKKLIDILNEYENNKIEFDMDFDLNNDKLYCTELINEIYFKLFNENIYLYLYEIYGKSGITINSILKNKNFKEIIKFKKND